MCHTLHWCPHSQPPHNWCATPLRSAWRWRQRSTLAFQAKSPLNVFLTMVISSKQHTLARIIEPGSVFWSQLVEASLTTNSVSLNIRTSNEGVWCAQYQPNWMLLWCVTVWIMPPKRKTNYFSAWKPNSSITRKSHLNCKEYIWKNWHSKKACFTAKFSVTFESFTYNIQRKKAQTEEMGTLGFCRTFHQVPVNLLLTFQWPSGPIHRSSKPQAMMLRCLSTCKNCSLYSMRVVGWVHVKWHFLAEPSGGKRTGLLKQKS